MKKITLFLAETANLLATDSLRWRFLTRINLILAVMTLVYGAGFYWYTHDWRGLLPNIIEALLFAGVVIMNRNGWHFLSAHLTVLISNLTIIYYSALLGNMVEVHMLAIFYVGLAFYLFRDNVKHSIISISITALAWMVCEFNYYLSWVAPIVISRSHLFATRWLAIPFILILDTLMISLHIYVFWRKLKLRTQQFAAASHELRNAFQLIISIIEKERKEGNTSPHMDEMYRSALFVRQLVTAELDAAKMEDGKAEQVSFSSVEIKPFLDSIIAQNRFLAADKNITIDFNLSMPAYILTDQPAIIKIVNNLLSNAIKFSPVGSTITVQVFYTMERWQINVIDQGPGIDGNLLPEIYTPYVSKGGSLEGTGLGLFITRKLVRLLKGSLNLAPFNGGTKATVMLPLEVGTPPSLQHLDFSPEPLAGKTLLLIEDNEMLLTLMSKMMESAGAAVLTAQDAFLGFEIAKRQIPDIIILDLETTPKITGPAAIRMFKAYVPLRDVPIIVQSGATMRETVLETMKAGATRFFAKPFPYTEAIPYLQRLLSAREVIGS